MKDLRMSKCCGTGDHDFLARYETREEKANSSWGEEEGKCVHKDHIVGHIGDTRRKIQAALPTGACVQDT